MRKAILMMLLAVVSSSAAAEWVKIGDTSNATLYVDPTSIRRTGDSVTIGALYDLKTAFVSKTSGSQYVSQTLQTEYDCKKEQWRMLNFSWYSGSMGEGKMVEYLSDSYKWEPIPSGSAVEILWQFACSNK